MHAFNNRVKISGAQSDVPVTTLSADYNSDSTGDIPVVSSSNFDTFEGVGVGTTNHGYLKIGNEIIVYWNRSGSITCIPPEVLMTLVLSHMNQSTEVENMNLVVFH